MRVSSRRIVLATVTAIALVWMCATPAWAQTTATVGGTVKDAQGGIIPGATITLVSETRGTSLEAQSNTTGDFVFPNVTGDTYTLKITMDGFKTSERKGIKVSPGDRLAIGTMTVEVGALAETVVVSGEAPMIQSASGERSFVVSKESVESLPVAGRNFASFAALTPGVVGTTRLGGGSTNFQLDGVPIIDTGVNSQALQLNADAIEEVKVITSGYQAEYGRASGLQITGVTKSGSNRFRGSVFDIERDSDWNSNSWANVRNSVAKTVSKQRDWGYTIGGPIGKPGGKNSWFFFYSEQFSPRTTGGAINRFRVPTLLERQGDFSETTDNTGAKFNLIRDASTGLACTATSTAGCFQDGGVLGRIPQGRLYQLGLNILKTYPAPNANGLNYNLETTAPTDNRTTRQPTVRVDYQASSRLRLTAKYSGQLATAKPIPGSIPGFNDTFLARPAVIVPSATVDYTLTPKTVLEATWGMSEFRQQGGVPISPVTNRCDVGLCDFPLLYPDAGVAPEGSYQDEILAGAGAPFYKNSSRQILMAPTYTWGGRVSNAPPNNTYPAFLDMVRTNNLSLSVTKLMGSHTAKVGFQLDHSLKVQNLGTAGAIPFQGTINFGNDSNNPIDSGFGFANAALGIFSSYAQQNKLFEGHYIYNSYEWYLQDNWKVSSKLTLDYGLRLTNQGPQYDTKQQSSNFFVDKWNASSAPALFVPGCAAGASPCPTGRVAVNPITGASLGANSAVAIGTIVPNSGVLTNGIIQAGHGIAKENYTWPKLAVGPRLGAAYDVTGTSRFVLRGSGGLFFDRPTGQSVFSQIGNPPVGQASTVQYAQLQSLASSGLQTQAPPNVVIYYYDSKLPSSVQWNGGVQMTLPWSSSLDVSYVGSHGFNLIALAPTGVTIGQNVLDLNAPDIGAAYLAANQDPTVAASAIPGASAVSTDLMRPYRGLGAILTAWGRFNTQYDSIQTSFNRRFRGGWQGGLNWTLGLRTTGNTASPLHFEHGANGSLGVRADQAQTDKLLENTGNRRHLIKGNFVWNLPGFKGTSAAAKGLGAVINDWQLSGVLTAGSGSSYDATFSYQTNGANVNLTGSPNYPARIRLVGDPGKGCSSKQYAQFNVAAFAGPTYQSTGAESGANLLTGCPDRTVDLALARNIRLGGNRQAQFRVDAFNVFNTVVISGRATQLQLNTPGDSTIRNPQFNSDGTLNSARLTPLNAGFGAANAAQALRTLQVQLRFQF